MKAAIKYLAYISLLVVFGLWVLSGSKTRSLSANVVVPAAYRGPLRLVATERGHPIIVINNAIEIVFDDKGLCEVSDISVFERYWIKYQCQDDAGRSIPVDGTGESPSTYAFRIGSGYNNEMHYWIGDLASWVEYKNNNNKYLNDP